MALQIRRGTDAERLTITPAEGELIYTTDTKLLYVGDGTTVGGTKADTGINDLAEDTTPQLGGTLDLNSNNITGVGNISNSGNITATGVVSAASGNFTSATIGLATGNFKGTFAADDSTVLIDGVSGKVNLAPNAIGDIGNVHNSVPTDGDALVWNGTQSRWEAGAPANAGDVVGSVYSDDSTLKIDGITGISYGPFVGDLSGSVFADDSSLLVDGVTGSLNVTNSTLQSLGTLNNIADGDGELTVTTKDGRMSLALRRRSDSDISSDDLPYGQILFGRDDINGTLNSGFIAGSQTGLFLSYDSTGLHTNGASFFTIRDGNFGIGTFTPTTKLEVVGNVKASSFTGTYTADDSTIIVDGVDQSANLSTITASGFIQFGGYSTTERDALTAANGMVIYNTSLNVFQGYQNSAWITFTTS